MEGNAIKFVMLGAAAYFVYLYLQQQGGTPASSASSPSVPPPSASAGSAATAAAAATSSPSPVPGAMQAATTPIATSGTITDPTTDQLIKAATDRTFAAQLAPSVAYGMDAWNWYNTQGGGDSSKLDPLLVGFTAETRGTPLTALQYWAVRQRFGLGGLPRNFWLM